MLALTPATVRSTLVRPTPFARRAQPSSDTRQEHVGCGAPPVNVWTMQDLAILRLCGPVPRQGPDQAKHLNTTITKKYIHRNTETYKLIQQITHECKVRGFATDCFNLCVIVCFVCLVCRWIHFLSHLFFGRLLGLGPAWGFQPRNTTLFVGADVPLNFIVVSYCLSGSRRIIKE